MTTDSTVLSANRRAPGLPLRRVALAVALALAALVTIAALVAFGYARMHDGRVLPGVSVGGVSIAGLDPAAAEARLRAALPDLRGGSLEVRIGNHTEQIGYSEIGRDLDFTAMLEQAMRIGRGGNPLEQIAEQARTLLGGVALDPLITYDQTELARRVALAAAAAEVQPVDASIAFEGGQFVIHPAVDGLSVDVAEMVRRATEAVAAMSASDAVVSVEPTVVPATVPTAAAQAAVERAQRLASAPLSLSVATETTSIDQQTITAWILLEQTAPGAWALTIDEEAVAQLVASLKASHDKPAIEAEFRFDDVAPVAVPGQTGMEMDAAAATAAILAALQARADGQPPAPVTLPVVVTEPEFTTADAEELVGRVRLLGEWTTNYVPSTRNFNGINIRRPAELINGTVLPPGDEFDFIDVAGPITRANGYGDGAAIIRGNTRDEGILGGGLCSASTTMFNAALRAGFDMGVRRNHSYYINRYPVGLDATIWISGNYRQTMSFTNDTGYPVVIRGINKKRSVTFEVWGVDDGRTVELSKPIVANEREASNFYVFTDSLAPRRTERIEYPADGFSSSVTRTVRDAAGNVIHQDTYRSNYRRVDGIVLLGRYPGDPPAGTRIPFGSVPPAPRPDPTPNPNPDPPPATRPPDRTPGPDPTPRPTKPPKPTPGPTNPPTPTPTPSPIESPADPGGGGGGDEDPSESG